jgi:hypothetical protein
MGTMLHGNVAVDFEDRLLAHLQIVVIQRFRRHEPLVMSWLDSLAIGDGRSSIWMTPSLPVYFKFAGSRSPLIDEQWLHRLTESASSSTGLLVTGADGDLARALGSVQVR